MALQLSRLARSLSTRRMLTSVRGLLCICPFPLYEVSSQRCISSSRTHSPPSASSAIGTKVVFYSSSLWLELEDVELMSEGEEITLMKWGNCFVRKISKDAVTGRINGVEGELHLEGDFKKTEKKVSWLADTPDSVPAELVELDYLITVCVPDRMMKHLSMLRCRRNIYCN